jgi:hypothetical protein
MSYAGDLAAIGCPTSTSGGQVVSISTFRGAGLASTIGGGGVAGNLTLSYVAADGSTQIVQSGGAVSFGRIEEGTSSTVGFTLTNTSAQSVTAPAISVSAGVFTLTTPSRRHLRSARGVPSASASSSSRTPRLHSRPF